MTIQLKSTLSVFTILVALVSSSACTIHTITPAEVPQDPGVPEATVAPPPPQEEPVVVQTQPSPSHIWIAGHWAWRGGNWAWVSGRWHLGQPGQVWVAGHWRHHRHGRWRWVPGHWQRR